MWKSMGGLQQQRNITLCEALFWIHHYFGILCWQLWLCEQQSYTMLHCEIIVLSSCLFLLNLKRAIFIIFHYQKYPMVSWGEENRLNKMYSAALNDLCPLGLEMIVCLKGPQPDVRLYCTLVLCTLQTNHVLFTFFVQRITYTFSHGAMLFSYISEVSCYVL